MNTKLHRLNLGRIAVWQTGTPQPVAYSLWHSGWLAYRRQGVACGPSRTVAVLIQACFSLC